MLSDHRETQLKQAMQREEALKARLVSERGTIFLIFLFLFLFKDWWLTCPQPLSDPKLFIYCASPASLTLIFLICLPCCYNESPVQGITISWEGRLSRQNTTSHGIIIHVLFCCRELYFSCTNVTLFKFTLFTGFILTNVTHSFTLACRQRLRKVQWWWQDLRARCWMQTVSTRHSR